MGLSEFKTNIKHTLFELVYSFHPFLPLEFLVPFYHMGCSLNYNQLATLMTWMEDLYLLDEWKKEVSHNNETIQSHK
jgi:hypothetical protein